MGIGVGALPRDDNGVAVLGLWNDATGKPVPVHIGALVTGADGNTYAKLDTSASVAPAANQRVNAQSADFVAGSIVDLATLSAIVSGAKAAVKAGAGDFVDLATLAGAIVSGKMQIAPFVSGSALSNANPFPTSDMISALIASGKSFSATTTKLATATNANLLVGAGLNNNNSAKTAIVYSIEMSIPAVGFFQLFYNSSAVLDTSLSNALTIVNPYSGGSAASCAAQGTPSANTASVVANGTKFTDNQLNTNLTNELLPNGRRIVLPANLVSSFGAYFTIATAGNSYSITISWVEF